MRYSSEILMVLAIVCILVFLCIAAGCTASGTGKTGILGSGSSGGSGNTGGFAGTSPNAYFTVDCRYERYDADKYTGIMQDKRDIEGTVPVYIDESNARAGGEWQATAQSDNLTAIASHTWTCSEDQIENGCVPQSASYGGPGYFYATIFHHTGDPVSQVSLSVGGSARNTEEGRLMPYYTQSEDTIYESYTDSEKAEWRQTQADMMSNFVLMCGPEFFNNNQLTNAANGMPTLSLLAAEPLIVSDHKKTDTGYTNIDTRVTLHKGAAPLPTITTLEPLAPLVTSEPLAPLVPGKGK